MRAGVRRYTALLAMPGARGPVLLSAVGSMPIGMFGLAILLLARESYEAGALVAGAIAFVGAVLASARRRTLTRPARA